MSGITGDGTAKNTSSASASAARSLTSWTRPAPSRWGLRLHSSTSRPARSAANARPQPKLPPPTTATFGAVIVHLRRAP
jgi:hypothetical protein